MTGIPLSALAGHLDLLLGASPGWIESLRLPVLGRLTLALVLGAAVGLERELSGKPAGLRTNILICIGAELITELSVVVAAQFAPHDLIRADPGRIAAQVVSGIGFIGAGTILVARGNVMGLTTAATLWVVAAIGMTVGLHLYVEAVGAAVLVVITLVVLGKFEEKVLSERAENTLLVSVAADSPPRPAEEVVRDQGLELRRLGHDRRGEEVVYRYGVKGPRAARDGLFRRLAELEEVRGAGFE